MADETQVSRTEGEAVLPEALEPGPLFSPQVDIVERSDSVVVLADLPGISREEVEIVLEKGVLSITTRAKPPEDQDTDYHRKEYDTGNYHRCFSVGEGLEADGVEATMKDGVLRLVIPKSPRYQPRRIEISGQ